MQTGRYSSSPDANEAKFAGGSAGVVSDSPANILSESSQRLLHLNINKMPVIH